MARITWRFCVAGIPTLVAFAACAGGERCTDPVVPPDAPVVQPTPEGFLKGQLHMHTSGSGDSETPPAIAIDWYARQGFDFVVITDHNVMTSVSSPSQMLVFRGMELTQNLATCEPPSPEGEPCLLHTSALFLSADAPATVSFPFTRDMTRLALYTRALDVATSRGALSVLNHPNFMHAADGTLIGALARRGLRFIEIENRAVDSMNEGDARAPSTEALWDEVLSSGARVFGTASDDAHHYVDAADVTRRGETAYVGGRGWVMVRSRRDEASIRAAMERGDFYASTGVTLETLALSRDRIAATASEEVTFEVVGRDGVVLHRVVARSLAWPIPGSLSGYVRLRAVDATGRKALAQPVFLD